MQNKESIIKLLDELLNPKVVKSSFKDGTMTYNGVNYKLPQTKTISGKRTTTLNFK